MARPLFTPEELEEMRRADEEIEREYRERPSQFFAEDREISKEIERTAKEDRLDLRSGRIAEQQREYRAANKDRIAEQQREYRAADWRRLHREEYNAYMREYLREYRQGRRRKMATAI